MGDRVLGALRFSFEVARLFDADERTFVEALAAQTAQAVDRSQLREAELLSRSVAESAAAGRDRTELVLRLAPSAGAAGHEYLAALDEVDAYARAARLLTLESAPEHRAFRRWYVTSLVEQLAAAARGTPPATPATFERYLLDELGVVATAKRLADRAARLQAVTAALAGTGSLAEVAQVVVSHGVTALEASGGVLVLPGAAGGLSVPGAVGYEDVLVDQIRAEPRDARLPAAVALTTGTAVWLESREDRDARFPELIGLEPATVSMCAVPLRMGDRVLGALRFSFEVARLFDADERNFVEALAAQTAQAVDRSQLREAERLSRSVAESAAERLARLYRVSATLAGASTLEEVGTAAVTEATQAVGAVLCALSVLDGETMHVVALTGGTASTQAQWQSFPLSATLPPSEAVRTGRPVVLPDRASTESRFPALAGYIAGDGASVSVPVTAGDRALGALSLRFEVGHVVDAGEVDLLLSVAQQCGVALERARLFAAERAAGDRSAFLAEAIAVLGSSLDTSVTMRGLTEALVPRIGDWAVAYRTVGSQVEAVSISHRDPEVAGPMLELARTNPIDPDAEGGIAEVLRSGRSIRYADVPQQVRDRLAGRVPDPHAAAEIAPSTGLAVPLIAHGEVLGALVVARTTGAAFSPEDLALVEELAGRAAVAVDNSQAYLRERDAALALQRTLLPQRLPEVPGVSFAWRYLPGAAGTHVGGDWYDVIPLEDGRVGLVIGDVMGRGVQAAAVMGQLRATARAHAAVEVSPSEVLRRLDIALTRLEQDQITTMLFGLLDPATRSLTVATAGHLPPLLVEGTARYLDVVPGPPLGAGGGAYPELHVVLPPRAMLLLYTDGLVEDRGLPVDHGLATLRDAAGSATTPEELCQVALAALGRDTQHDDDTAVLAVALDD
jgi:GAF domain-containing protein